MGNVRRDDAGRLEVETGAVRFVAQDAWTGPPLEGPVSLALNFVLLRPASVSRTKRPYPTVKPDASKLLRAVEDALTGVVYRDDSQIVDLTVTKRFGLAPGVEVRVEAL